MKMLFDTNVILDVLIEREPFYLYSARCMASVEERKTEGWICSTTVTTIAYLLRKELTSDNASKHIESLLTLFDISTVNKKVLIEALHNGFTDYEDSVLAESAVVNNLEGIITRNKKDFKASKLPVYTPKEFLAILSQIQ